MYYYLLYFIFISIFITAVAAVTIYEKLQEIEARCIIERTKNQNMLKEEQLNK